MTLLSASYANIDSVFVLFLFVFVLLSFVATLASRFIFVVARLVKLFGFGRRSNGILYQGGHGLNIGHCLGRNVMGKRVGGNRGWYGWDLHAGFSLLKGAKRGYCPAGINKQLIISCNWI